MTVTAFLGMRGNGDWATDERPKNWRQGILRLYPNGMAPLTAILSKMSERKVDDAEFNWWSKELPTQGGTVTGVYTETTLSTTLAAAASSGDTLYLKCALATANEFRAGHVALLRYSADPTVDVVAKVTDVHKNGASSYIACYLLEDDDNSTDFDLTNCDTILIIGTVNAEGAAMPDAIAYKPTKYNNYTQIFRTPISITRTAKKTKLRTEDAYKEAKRDGLELHSIEMEKAYIFGIPTEGTGSNSKPERTTGGIFYATRTYAPDNVRNFKYEVGADYAGKTWLEAGETWLDTYLEQIFRYGSQEKMAFCGSGAILGINRLVKAGGYFEYSSKTVAYGIKVVEWTTPFGTLFMKTHPLFSYNEVDRHTMMIFEPRLLDYRFIDDTNYYKDKSSGSGRIDGLNEEWLTECGLEYHFPEAFGVFYGVGQDNVVA